MYMNNNNKKNTYIYIYPYNVTMFLQLDHDVSYLIIVVEKLESAIAPQPWPAQHWIFIRSSIHISWVDHSSGWWIEPP